MAKIIEFLGRPGVGKSTLALDVFVAMKKQGLKVEFVSEVAKDMVYRSDNRISNQLLVSALQNDAENAVAAYVDYIVTDTSLLLAYIYQQDLGHKFTGDMLNRMRKDKQYLTLLVKQHFPEYQTYGRNHNEKESVDLGFKIEEYLHLDGHDYHTVSHEDVDRIIALALSK